MPQVFQDCDEDGGWPLEVVGEDGLVREVYLQPGEMVLYEGEHGAAPGAHHGLADRGTAVAWTSDAIPWGALWKHLHPFQAWVSH